MSGVAGLFNVPLTPSELLQWSHIHMASHRDINRRIFEALLLSMPEPMLDPFDPKNLGTWAEQHQQLHQLQNTVLGIRGNDLSDVPTDNESAWATWLYLNGQEHDKAEQILNGVTVNPTVKVYTTPGTYTITIPFFIGFFKIELWGGGGGGAQAGLTAAAGTDTLFDASYVAYGGAAGHVANVSPPPLRTFPGGSGGSYLNGGTGSVDGGGGQEGTWDIIGVTPYYGGGIGGSNTEGGGGGSGTGYVPSSPGTSPLFPGGDGGSPGGGGGGTSGASGGGAGGYLVNIFYPGGIYYGGGSVVATVGSGGLGARSGGGTKAGGDGAPGAIRISWR